jgi:hypothetical protein
MMHDYDTHSEAFEPTRRSLCMMGAGLCAAALFEFKSSPVLAATDTSLPTISYVVTDRRIRHSAKFGASLAELGIPTLEVTDGLTRVWRDALVPLWRGTGGAVAGITDHGTWACIAEQARSHRRRSILVGRHAEASVAGSASHFFTTGGAPAEIAALLGRSGNAWPRVLADLVTRYPLVAQPVANLQHHGLAIAGTIPALTLTSWIIA